MTSAYEADRVLAAERHPRRRPDLGTPHNPPQAVLLALQRSAGNAAVAGRLAALSVQRCGPTPCGCSDEERDAYAAEHPRESAVQRAAEPGGLPSGGSIPERARAGILLKIAGARERIAGQESLMVTPDRLAELDRHLTSSKLTLPALGGEVTPDGTTAVPAATLDALLTALEASIASPAGPPVQRSVQRLLDPATAAALAAAGVAAGETAEAGGAIAGVAAPETGGLSLLALGAAALVVGAVVGITVYATYQPAPTTAAKPGPAAVPQAPVMPQGISKPAKEKWRQCTEMHDKYDVTKKEVADLAAAMNALGQYSGLTPSAKTSLCALVRQQLAKLEQLLAERRKYIDAGCDDIDWFPQKGTTPAQRRQAHLDEIDHVRAQQANMRRLLAQLQADKAC